MDNPGTQVWAVFIACALSWATVTGVISRALWLDAPTKRFAVPLLIVGGARLFLLGTCMTTTLFTLWLVGEDVFSVPIEHQVGQQDLTSTVRYWTMRMAEWGVMAMPIELIYVLFVHILARRRFWRMAFAMWAAFAVLILWLISDMPFYLPTA